MTNTLVWNGRIKLNVAELKDQALEMMNDYNARADIIKKYIYKFKSRQNYLRNINYCYQLLFIIKLSFLHLFTFFNSEKDNGW